MHVIIVAQHIGEESNDPGWFVGYTEAIQTGFEEFDRIVTVKSA